MCEVTGTSHTPPPAKNQGDPNTSSLGVISQLGNSQSFSLINIDRNKFWILDSSATIHLTGSSEHFIAYLPCAGNEKIRIADGSFAPIAGKGHISPFEGLTL